MRARPTQEMLRFIVAGAFNTGVSYAVYAAGLWAGLPYPVANFGSLVAGLLVGFVTQGHFVFRRLDARRFPRFVLFWLAMWGLNVLLIAALLPLFGGNAYAAGAVTLVVMVVLSFAVQKHLVFGGGSGR